jgi:hypothetical protein
MPGRRYWDVPRCRHFAVQNDDMVARGVEDPSALELGFATGAKNTYDVVSADAPINASRRERMARVKVAKRRRNGGKP